MAKTSSILRNMKKLRKAKAAKTKRDTLRNIIKKDEQNRDEALVKLQKRPRDESLVRVRNRCRACGRPKGTYRKFGLCRIHLREAVMRGDVPGVRKASW